MCLHISTFSTFRKALYALSHTHTQTERGRGREIVARSSSCIHSANGNGHSSSGGGGGGSKSQQKYYANRPRQCTTTLLATTTTTTTIIINTFFLLCVSVCVPYCSPKMSRFVSSNSAYILLLLLLLLSSCVSVYVPAKGIHGTKTNVLLTMVIDSVFVALNFTFIRLWVCVHSVSPALILCVSFFKQSAKYYTHRYDGICVPTKLRPNLSLSPISRFDDGFECVIWPADLCAFVCAFSSRRFHFLLWIPFTFFSFLLPCSCFCWANIIHLFLCALRFFSVFICWFCFCCCCYSFVCNFICLLTLVCFSLGLVRGIWLVSSFRAVALWG